MFRLLAALFVILWVSLAHAEAGAKTRVAFLEDLSSQFGGSSQPLPPEKAFKLELRAAPDGGVIADFQVAKDHYLYRDKLKFVVKDPDASVGAINLPAGEIKTDPYFGRTEIYRGPFQARLALKRPATVRQVTLTATFQGCNEKIGVCYPPMDRTATVTLAERAAAAGPVAEPEPPADDSGRIAQLFQGGSFWLVIGSFFVAGLLLSLTPCVFPMIPILSGIIAGGAHPLTKTRGLALSGAYVLGMALTYSAAGVAAGLSGSLISNALQNPWILGTFAAVFVALALSMFGFYDLQLPSSLQSRLTETSNRLHGGKVAAVFVMGALSAVIVGPCVAAPLAGALLYIGKTRDVWLGGSALFAMALGMGVPLLAVGLSAGALLPKTGPWMQTVKNFFGVLLLGVAIWLVSPVIPAQVHMLLWAALLIVTAMYLHALDPLPPHAKGFARFLKGTGVIALLVGASLLVGALAGSRDVLQPLAGLSRSSSSGTGGEALKFHPVASIESLDAKLREAQGKPVMLDFYADWCVSCKEFERFTFGDPAVQAKLKQVVLLRADVTQNTEADKALLARFGLFGPPGILLFDGRGQEIATARLVGYESAEAFARRLDRALTI